MTAPGVNINLPSWVYLAAGGVVSGLVLYVAMRGPGGVAEDVTGGLGDVLGGALKGTGTAAGAVIEGGIVGIGNAMGIDKTSAGQCQRDIAEGNTWAASFSCPAADFLKYVFK